MNIYYPLGPNGLKIQDAQGLLKFGTSNISGMSINVKNNFYEIFTNC